MSISVEKWTVKTSIQGIEAFTERVAIHASSVVHERVQGATSDVRDRFRSSLESKTRKDRKDRAE